jgi:uncharacterized membrane protein
MDLLNIILGILLIILGVYLIKLTNEITLRKKQGGFTFQIGVGGVGFIMIGIALIAREFNFF